MSLRGTLARGALNYTTTGGVMALNVVAGVLLARALGPAGRGEVAIVTLWPGVFSYVLDMGISTALTYSIARTGHRPRLAPLAYKMLWWQLIVGASALPFLLGKNIGLAPLAVAYFVVFLPLTVATRLLTADFIGAEDAVGLNVVRISFPVLYVGLLLPGALLGGGMTSELALAANIGANALCLLLAWRIRAKRAGALGQPASLRSLLAYGLKAHLGHMTPVDGLHLDIAVVAAFMSVTDAGLYAAAAAASAPIRAVGVSLGLALMPATARRGTDASHDLGKRSLVAGLAGAGILALPLYAFLGYLMPLLYGEDFSGAVTPARVLILAGVLATGRQIVGDYLRGRGHPASASWAEAVSLLLLVIGVLIIPKTLLNLTVVVASAYAVALVSQLCSWMLIAKHSTPVATVEAS